MVQCVVLCVAYRIVAQFLEHFNRSLDWVLSHWAHFTVLRFIFVYVSCAYYTLYYCNMVRWTWWN